MIPVKAEERLAQKLPFPSDVTRNIVHLSTVAQFRELKKAFNDTVLANVKTSLEERKCFYFRGNFANLVLPDGAYYLYAFVTFDKTALPYIRTAHVRAVKKTLVLEFGVAMDCPDVHVHITQFLSQNLLPPIPSQRMAEENHLWSMLRQATAPGNSFDERFYGSPGGYIRAVCNMTHAVLVSHL